MTHYWLFKSEPSAWSWDAQVKAGAKGTGWTGVRNHLAKQQMMAMKKGDLGFFYHSNEGKEMVGIIEVVKEFHPDPTDEKKQFGMVDVKAVKPLPKPVTLADVKAVKPLPKPVTLADVKAVKPLPKPVTLADVKATPALAKMSLVTSARLSVQPVTEKEWKLICKMAGL